MAAFWDGPHEEGWQSLSARLEEQTKYFWAINSVSNAIGSALTTDELLSVALERTVEVLAAVSGTVYVPAADGSWQVTAAHNAPPGAFTMMVNASEPTLRLALESDGPVTRSERLDEPSRFVSPAYKDFGVQCWAGVPITALGTVAGVLFIASREYNAFSRAQLELLRVIAQLTGLALSNTMVHKMALARVDTQLQRRVAELEAILASISDGLVICDNQGTVARVNEAAIRLLALPKAKIIGQSMLSDRWNRRPPDAIGESVDGPLRKTILQGEECVNCPIEVEIAGRPRILNVSASPIRESAEQYAGTVIVLRDITEERNTEMLKEEFLSILSHELRAPLTVISGYAQILRRKLSKRELDNEIEYADLIKEQATRMSSMVGDLVESSRLESGMQTIEKEETNLGELVEGVVKRMRAEQRHSATKHELQLSIEVGLPEIQVDKRRIDQVLTNLISNAIRYSPDGGRIRVAVKRDAQSAQHNRGGSKTATGHSPSLLVLVTDQGVGIPPDERAHIFDRAFRGKRAQAISMQGLGLGLYICKIAVEAHDGKIGVTEGPKGVGTTFWFTLPLPPTSRTS